MPFAWTSKRVCAVLVETFRARPTLPVHSAWPVHPVLRISAIDVELNWDLRFLTRDPDGWRYLRLWAWCRAHEESASEVILELGIRRKVFENGWRRAAAAVADGLNLERVNRAQLLAGEASEDRLVEQGRIEVLVAAPAMYRLTREKSASDGSSSEHEKNRSTPEKSQADGEAQQEKGQSSDGEGFETRGRARARQRERADA